MTEFGTRAVHAGLDPDPSYGSVVPAIHQSSTYVQPAPGQFVEDYDYSRAANPTRRALENALGELEGGHATAFASGMAATHALLTAACSAGDHVVMPDDLYGGTYRLVDKILARFGIAYDMVDQTDLAAVRAALRPETKLVWVETPTNPTLKVIDLPAVIEAVGPDVLVAVDSTFATPFNQRPLEPAPARSCTRRPSTSAGTPTPSAARSSCRRRAARGDPLRAALDRRRPRPARLLPRAPRPAHAAPADGGARGEREGGERVPARAARRRGRALAGLLRDGVLPPSRGAEDRRGDEAVRAGGVARRRRVADRGAAGDDPPVRRGLRGGGPGRPRAAQLRDRGRVRPGGGPAPGDRRRDARRRPG